MSKAPNAETLAAMAEMEAMIAARRTGSRRARERFAHLESMAAQALEGCDDFERQFIARMITQTLDEHGLEAAIEAAEDYAYDTPPTPEQIAAHNAALNEGHVWVPVDSVFDDETAHLLSTEANEERLAASIAQLDAADRKPSQRDLRDTAVRLTTNGCWCDECETIEADIERLAEEQGHDVALMHALTLAGQGRRGRLEQLRHRIRDVGVYRAWVSWWRFRSIARKLRRMNREGDQ